MRLLIFILVGFIGCSSSTLADYPKDIILSTDLESIEETVEVTPEVTIEVPEVGLAKWYRGNLHTHSYWSDGHDYPEMIIDWYKENGYNFIALSDHNSFSKRSYWTDVDDEAIFDKYVDRFGSWVRERIHEGIHQVTLNGLLDYEGLFNDEEFLILSAEEITEVFEGKSVHVGATGIEEYIAPQGGSSVLEIMQNNVDQVVAQRKLYNKPMIAHIAHPNMAHSVTSEDLIALEGDRFFEIYNAHSSSANEGDAVHGSMENIWDIVTKERILLGKDIMYGLAVDDAHEYQGGNNGPGKGWIYVRSESLTSRDLITAMERGDFYSSTGVELTYQVGEGRILVEVVADSHNYTIKFIGSLEGSDTVGRTLQSTDGNSAEYIFEGNELYVRAVVTSSKLKDNYTYPGEREQAWLQPVTREQVGIASLDLLH